MYASARTISGAGKTIIRRLPQAAFPAVERRSHVRPAVYPGQSEAEGLRRLLVDGGIGGIVGAAVGAATRTGVSRNC